MNREFLDAIEANPIIAAVKDEQGLANCLRREELTVIFFCMEISVPSEILWSEFIRQAKSPWYILIL